MGGGESIDQKWRTLGENWFYEERIDEVDKWDFIDAVKESPIDVFVAHVPPPAVIAELFPPLKLWEWGLDLNWSDVSSKHIEFIWNAIGKPPMYCGHMHRSCWSDGCRILDINEAYTYDPAVTFRNNSR